MSPWGPDVSLPLRLEADSPSNFFLIHLWHELIVLKPKASVAETVHRSLTPTLPDADSGLSLLFLRPLQCLCVPQGSPASATSSPPVQHLTDFPGNHTGCVCRGHRVTSQGAELLTLFPFSF